MTGNILYRNLNLFIPYNQLISGYTQIRPCGECMLYLQYKLRDRNIYKIPNTKVCGFRQEMIFNDDVFGV